ncbi:hypothetical protein ACVVIH_07015 [Chryseobacterium arthrosphaerae]
MKYLTRAWSVDTPKSKVDKSIHDFLLMNDRLIIEDGFVEEFKEKVVSNITFICQEDKGNPYPVLWVDLEREENDFSLAGLLSISFYLYEIKGTAEFNIDKK